MYNLVSVYYQVANDISFHVIIRPSLSVQDALQHHPKQVCFIDKSRCIESHWAFMMAICFWEATFSYKSYLEVIFLTVIGYLRGGPHLSLAALWQSPRGNRVVTH